MNEEIKQIFGNPKLIEQINKTSLQYQFGMEEDISLKSLLLTLFLLTRKEETLYIYFSTIVESIINTPKQKCFDQTLMKIIDLMFQHNPNDVTLSHQLLYQYLIDGYCFHSFNASFLDSILENGLTLYEKPWDNNEIETIKNLFSNHGIKQVFGFYQGKKETPLFFASSLNSSLFYAYSSPTWFRHFVSGGMKGEGNVYDKQAFFYRNYQSAIKNVTTLCHEAHLNNMEIEQVLSFFEKNWSYLASQQLPCIALLKRNAFEDIQLLEKEENESMVEYTKRIIHYYGEKNHIVKQNIAKTDLLIFPYQLEKLAEINLSNKKDY